jgi:hypothetical protein
LVHCVCCAAAVFGGCAAISEYSVVPTRVCPGELVTIGWKATGSVTLEGTPPVEVPELPSEGQTSVKIAASTRLVITARRLWSSDQREWDVVVMPGAPAKPFGGLATCDDAARTIAVSFAITPQQMSGTGRALRVSNPYDRAVTVHLDDIEQTLSPKGSTDAFRQRPAQGNWTVKTPLLAEETCSSGLAAVASRLAVKLQMSCGD